MQAILERNLELEREVASLRQEMQAMQHSSSQLQLQWESSQQLILQLRAAAEQSSAAAAVPKPTQPPEVTYLTVPRH